MTFEEIMKGFAAKIGGGLELRPDESGAVALDIDGMTLTIVGLDELGLIALRAPVGEPPPEDRMERLYKALLVANHNFAGTSGATLSIDPDSSAITLERLVPMPLTDGESFFGIVETFVNTMETWRKLVADFRGADLSRDGAGTDAAGDVAPPADGFGGFMRV